MRNAKATFQTLCVLILAYNVSVAQTPLETDRADSKAPSQSVEIKINDSQRIKLKAKIDPVGLALQKTHKGWYTLDTLRAAEETKEYAASVLRAVLPDAPVSVGNSWRVKPSIVDLLKQFHKGATLELHINDQSKGGWAILRAINAQWVEIRFRLHGQFVLEDGWITPSQFNGRVVIDRRSGKVAYFRMHVPQFPLNFDVGRRITYYKDGVPQNAADAGAGYCPRIELVGGGSSATDEVKWSESLPINQADQKLALQFYPAWKIDWIPWNEALAKAQQLKKPLHVVSADGPFKDEAC